MKSKKLTYEKRTFVVMKNASALCQISGELIEGESIKRGVCLFKNREGFASKIHHSDT